MTNTIGLAIRDATAADAPVIAAITRAAFEEYRGVLDPASGALLETAAAIAAFLGKGGALLALLGGEPVGCARMSPEAERTLRVSRLAVLPGHRRRGIGRALMAAAEERALAGGLHRVVLGVRVNLPGNLSFYRALGYRVESEHRHPGYDRVTWFQLEKVLENPAAS